MSGLSMIGCFNCSITGVVLQPTVCRITLSDYNSTEKLVKNKAINAPNTFEEFVMIMITSIIKTVSH